MLDFQHGLCEAGRVTPQVTATCSPPHSLFPDPPVTTSSPCSGYQARDACMKHDVVRLADFSHTNHTLFLTLQLSKTGEETFPSSFPQLSTKHVLPPLLFSQQQICQRLGSFCEELAFSSDLLLYTNYSFSA